MSNKTIKFSIISFFIIIIFALGFYLTWLERKDQQKTQTIGLLEMADIVTPNGNVQTKAKVDTGADFSSIDKNFAQSIGLSLTKIKKVKVVSSTGTQVRDAIAINFILGNKTISTDATVADRSQLSTDLLIGKKDLSGFQIDPSSQFLTQPQAVSFVHFFGPFANLFLQHTARNAFILIFAILGAVIVLERLLIGFRTFGIFAPVVIAITLFQVGIIEGMFIYIIFLTVGVILKIYLMKKFKLPHISEISILMFALCLLFMIAASLPLPASIALSFVFFPLIITSHLVEKISKTIEDNKISDALSILISTLLIALFLSIIGALMFRLDMIKLWIIFIAAFIAVILVGHYKGLRLTEFIRFKYLERKK